MFSPMKIVCFLPMFLLRLQLARCKPGPVFPTAASCLTHECPLYTVIYTDVDYEIREYKVSSWVSSSDMSSTSYRLASMKEFLILFSYYNGNNEEGVTVNMTAPVFVEIKNMTAPVYTVYFYVPKIYQCESDQSLPTPLSPRITEVMLPTLQYAAVRRYNRSTTDKTIANEVVGLKASLKDSTRWSKYFVKSTSFDEITVAIYNNPLGLMSGLLNEVIVFFDGK